MRKIMSGNEAAARGAFETGVAFASAYPEKPSTEILENPTQIGRARVGKECRSRWSPYH